MSPRAQAQERFLTSLLAVDGVETKWETDEFAALVKERLPEVLGSCDPHGVTPTGCRGPGDHPRRQDLQHVLRPVGRYVTAGLSDADGRFRAFYRNVPKGAVSCG